MASKQTPLLLDYPFGQTSAILTEPQEVTSTIVVLCHGFLSNKDSRTNIRLTDLLTLKGIATLRFDWFGMGRSSGSFSDITVTACHSQLESLLQEIKEKGFRNIGLVGSSFGGLLAILVAANHPELFALGLVCPVPDFQEMLDVEFGKKGIAKWKETNTIPNVTGGSEPVPLNFAFYKNCEEFNAYAQAKKVSTPCLIVHGQQDELVPFHQIQQLEQSLMGKKQLHLLSEADHHFGKPEDFRIMSIALADWMANHAPKPEIVS